MSRSGKALTDAQDAYGHLISDRHNGRDNVEVVEREDGYIDTKGVSNCLKFSILL